MSSRGIVDLRNKKPSAPTRRTASAPRSSYSRVSPVRVRRRRTRVALGLGVIVVLAAIVWGISYVSYLPQLSVQYVSVQGAQAVPEGLITDFVQTILHDGAFHYISRSNIFAYPKQEIASGIPGYFPRIRAASASRPEPFSTTLTITVEERTAFALWCLPAQAGAADDSCYLMDQSGFIFAEASSTAPTESRYVFRGAIDASPEVSPIGSAFAKAHMPGLLALLTSLGQAGFQPAGVTVMSEKDFVIPMQNGLLVKAAFGSDGGLLVRNLELVLASDVLSGKLQNLEYIDLRFGNDVYYKMKDEAATARYEGE